MSKSSEIKLKDIRGLIEPLCPIQIYYNNKIVWDDNRPIGDKLCEPETYEKFWEEFAEDIISKYKVEITHFHHSIVKIKSLYE